MDAKDLLYSLTIFNTAALKENRELTLDMLMVFLFIYQNNDTTRVELKKQFKIKDATMTRIIYALGEGKKHSPQPIKGLRWVEEDRDNTDYRTKRLSLSDKGQALIKCLGGVETNAT